MEFIISANKTCLSGSFHELADGLTPYLWLGNANARFFVLKYVLWSCHKIYHEKNAATLSYMVGFIYELFTGRVPFQ